MTPPPEQQRQQKAEYRHSSDTEGIAEKDRMRHLKALSCKIRSEIKSEETR